MVPPSSMLCGLSLVFALLLFGGLPPSVTAQIAVSNATSGVCPCPDILLNISNIGVDNITLEVTNLQAHLNLNAKIGDFVSLTAGVDASIANVRLEIINVKARADLTVRLDNVYKIVSRALDTVDRNPQILTSLIQAVTNLLQTTVDAVGNVVQTVVTQAGEILERTLNQAGTLLSSQLIGNIQLFPLVGNYTDTASGLLVKIFQDPSTGNLIEATFNALGNVTAAKVLKS